MANLSYSGLQVVVSADTGPLARSIRGAAISAGEDAADQISGRLAGAVKPLAAIAGSIGKAAATGLAVATGAAVGFGVQAYKTAARVGEMDATLRALAVANKLSYPQMQRVVGSIRKQGIEANVAQGLVAQFARNQLDLAKGTDLARVAQDAAVISGQNSTEVLDQLVHGITTQNSLVLRNAGVNVQAGAAMDAYAKSLGKSSRELTESERAQAVLNAVLREGKNVAGAYAAAMEEPGKVLRSYPRIIDDIKLSIGRPLLQAFGPIILKGYELAKAISVAVGEGGKLAPVVAEIGNVARRIAGPVQRVIERITAFIKALDAPQVQKMTAAVRRFGPAILAAGAGLAAFAAPALTQRIPVVGELMQNLQGPLKLVSGEVLNIGKAALTQLIPGLSGVVGPAQGLGAALGSAALPVTAVAAGIALLLKYSPEFRAAVIDLGRELMTALRPALDIVLGVIKDLMPVVAGVARVLGSALAGVIRSTVVPILRVLASVLRTLEPVLGPMIKLWIAWKVATMAWTVATKIATVVQWAMNSSLLAFPGTWIVLGIAAVVAAVILMYKNFSWFRTAVNATWNAIKVFGGWLKDYLVPIIKIVAAILLLPMVAAIMLAIAAWNRHRNVIIATWNAIRAAITAAWNAVIRPLLNAQIALLRAVGNTFLWLFRNAARPALQGIGWAAQAAWNTAIRPALNAIQAGLRRTADAFSGAVRVIRRAWDAIKQAVNAPLRWVAFSVINPFLRGANKLLGKIGLSIPLIPSFGAAAGGKVPGGWGGGDRVIAALEPGEWVLTKEQARAAGYQNLRRMPRYQEGGMVVPGGPVGRWNPASWAMGTLKGVGNAFAALGKMTKDAIVEPFSGLLREAAAAAFKVGVKPFRVLLDRAAGSSVPPGFFKQVVGKLGIQALDAVINFIEGKVAPDYEVGGVGIAALAAQVIKQFPALRVTSALRPGDKGYHGKGLARDLGGPTGVMAAAGRWIGERFASALLEGIHNPTLSVKNGKRVSSAFWGSATWAGHRDHIHLASQEGAPGTPGMAGGPENVRRVVRQVLRELGKPAAHENAWMARLKQESGFNANAVNRWDSNWKAGHPSVGVAQVIRGTFQAFAGKHRNTPPFMYGVSTNLLANIFAGMNYAYRRYGPGILRAIAGTKGYAQGGPITEPITGIGRSGQLYRFGERGPEWVSPLRGPGADLGPGTGRITINVYPRANQSEVEIAAQVNRSLRWAEATGRTR